MTQNASNRSSGPLKLGIVSDEISEDFSEAISHGRTWGISIYELRCLKSGRVPSVSPTELKQVLELVSNEGITISALSPGIFKRSLSKKTELQHELDEILPRTIEMAGRLGTKQIIVFGFHRGSDGREYYKEGVALMQRAAETARRNGMRLAIENEPGFWCDSGANTALFIRDVGSDALGANWDPCNGYGTKERPFPEGYKAVKDCIFNVHVKDTMEGALIKCVPVGEGAIDWKGQLRALVNDRIVDHATIETHCLPLIENSKKNVDTLRSYLAEIQRTEEVSYERRTP